jgi:hypothetical protein
MVDLPFQVIDESVCNVVAGRTGTLPADFRRALQLDAGVIRASSLM